MWAGASRTPLRMGLTAVIALSAAPAGAALARTVRIGQIARWPARATVASALAPSERLHVTVTLRPRDPAALTAYAHAVSTPGSSVYEHYLSPSLFARRFGPTRAQIAIVRRSLQARGLRPGPTSAGGLSIPLHATVAELQHGLSLSLLRLSLPGRRTAIAASAAPALSAAAAPLVQSVVGLDSLSHPHPLLVRPRLPRTPRSAGSPLLAPVPLAVRAPLRAAPAQARSPRVITGGPQPCTQAQSVATAQHAYTADEIASAYGFSGLYEAGDQGQGVTVALYELEPYAADDIAAYQACYGITASVQPVSVDGGAGSGSGSGEAALDIENLIGLAPAANVLVYQGPNSDSGAPGAGPYDTVAAIINQDRAQVISVSWGQCESAVGAANAGAENALFQQAAVQGQTIVAASGDSGSADCDVGGALGQKQLAVDDPSSQPFVTGVGGTTLASPGPRPVETVWNSGGTVASGLLQPGAGGGGISDLWPMSAAQFDAAPALNVLAAGPTGSQCGQPGGHCRQVPDVTANADPTTGYVIYYNDAGDGWSPSGWQAIGGTSAAAPVWAALLTLADASQPCAGISLGFVNPALYRAAGNAYAADFNDVQSGNNDFTGTNGASFTAHPGYDEASGLGSPNAAVLPADLCANTLRLVNPGAERFTARANVSERLRVEDPRGTGVSFSASGLPPGLRLDAGTGQISGTPLQTGIFKVSVIAQDAQGATASQSFPATVGAAPRLSHVALSGLRRRLPELSFTVTAGHQAPALDQLRIALPSLLKLSGARNVNVRARGVRRPRFSARVDHGILQITLRRSLAQLTVTLSHPALRTVSRRMPRERGHSSATSRLRLEIRDAGSGTSRLRTKLTVGS